MAEIDGVQLVDSVDEISGTEKDWYESVYASVSVTESSAAKRGAQALDSVNLMRVWKAKGSGALNRALRSGQFPFKYSRL